MNKELPHGDDIFESLLIMAVQEVSYQELATYPSDDELECVDDSRYDFKMRQFIKHQEHKVIYSHIKQMSIKIASIFFIIMGISFMALLSVDEVRASCAHFIETVYEQFIQHDLNREQSSSLSDYKINYIPGGYIFSEELSEMGFKKIIYIGDKSEQLVISFNNNEKSTSHIDNEDCIVKNFNIDNWTCQSFIYSNGKSNKLSMYANSISIMISGSINENELINIAKNIK